MFDSRLYHTQYATVKSRGVDENDMVHTLTVHKGPVKKSGYEDVETLKNLEKKEAAEPMTRFANSVCRSKQTVIQLVANNPWEYFVTLTISPDSDADRYNLVECKKKILMFFHNYARDLENFKYMLIPEFHADGVAVHFHGVMMGIDKKDLEMNRNGYLDFKPYCDRFGFCNMGKIRCLMKCANYISKYISKDMFLGSEIENNTHLYMASQGLKKDKVVAIGKPVVDVSEFLEGFEDKKQIVLPDGEIIDVKQAKSFENEYCIKIEFDNLDVAVACVEPFAQEHKFGVNIPGTIAPAEKKKAIKKAVVKFCQTNGTPVNAVSIGNMWKEIMEHECSFLNEYDRIKVEQTDKKNAEQKIITVMEKPFLNEPETVILSSQLIPEFQRKEEYSQARLM